MASTSRPIALADQQLEIVKAAARHIAPEGRCKFLQSVADALSGGECGGRRRCSCRAIGAAIRRAMDPDMTARLLAELVVIVMTTPIVGGALVLTAFVARALI